MKDLKTAIIVILILYVTFVITNLLHQNLHEFFGCEYLSLLDFWSCSSLHVISSIVFFVLLVLGAIIVIFKDNLD